MRYIGDRSSREIPSKSERQNMWDEHSIACDSVEPNLILSMAVVLSGLTRGDLAATTADALAHGGAATIIFTGRSQPELQSILDHIRRKHSYTKIIFFAAETGSLASMHEVAHSIIDLEGSIDGVICFPTLQATAWELTEDGVESQFQKNYLSYYVLVTLLLEKMTPGARVVLISTTIRREAPAPHWEDINFSVSPVYANHSTTLNRSIWINAYTEQNGETYHSLDGYAQSMFANIMFAKGLAGRHKSISAFSVSPGSKYTVQSVDYVVLLINSDTRTNIQTYVSPEQVAAWLQLKKRGIFTTTTISLWIIFWSHSSRWEPTNSIAAGSCIISPCQLNHLSSSSWSDPRRWENIFPCSEHRIT